jgi:chromosome segregation ATPase
LIYGRLHRHRAEESLAAAKAKVQKRNLNLQIETKQKERESFSRQIALLLLRKNQTQKEIQQVDIPNSPPKQQAHLVILQKRRDYINTKIGQLRYKKGTIAIQLAKLSENVEVQNELIQLSQERMSKFDHIINREGLNKPKYYWLFV